MIYQAKKILFVLYRALSLYLIIQHLKQSYLIEIKAKLLLVDVD